MATLDGIADIAQALDDRGVSVDTTLCVKARNRNATCQRCVEACNRGCITWESEGLAFDPENCNDCGACVSACPAGALSSRWKGDSQVYASCLQAAGHCEGDVVIACNVMLERAGKLVDQRKVAGVPCLERVSAELLAAVAVFSRASRVVLVHGACEECERLTGAEATCQMVEQVRSLLASWDYDVRLKVSGKLPGKVRMADDEGFDSSRRAFFAGMRDKARDAASTSVRVATKDMFEGDEEPVPAKPHVNRFGVLPPGTSGKREYLLAAVDALGTPACDFIDSPLWARVEIDTDQCVACRMCATFCPTGSLFKFHTKKGLIGVKQDVRTCVNCGCCRDICPSQALSLHEGITSGQLRDGQVVRMVLPSPDERQARFKASVSM